MNDRERLASIDGGASDLTAAWGLSSLERSSPAAPVGETCRSLFLSNHRGARGWPGRVFDDGKLRSQARDNGEFVWSFGDGGEEFQGTESVEYGSNRCGATSARSTRGHRSPKLCRVAARRPGAKARVW
jgi:hypothetical protein